MGCSTSKVATKPPQRGDFDYTGKAPRTSLMETEAATVKPVENILPSPGGSVESYSSKASSQGGSRVYGQKKLRSPGTVRDREGRSMLEVDDALTKQHIKDFDKEMKDISF